MFLLFDMGVVLFLFVGLLWHARGKKMRAARPLPRRRRWALALADIQLRRNGLPYLTDTLRLDLPTLQSHRLRHSVLAELRIDAGQPESGVRAAVQSALKAWAQGMGADLSPFFAQLASQGQVRHAMAFDCARTAFLVRCVALLGLCDEEAAWVILLLNGQRAQDTFDSWTDFGTAYAHGRHAWISQREDQPRSQRAELEVNEYLNELDSNWNRLPWAGYRIVDLPSSPKAQQLPLPTAQQATA